MDGSDFLNQYNVLAFSNLVLFRVLPWVNRIVFSRSIILRVLLFSHIAYPIGFSVTIFCSQIILFLYHPVVGMSGCAYPLLADRIFFAVLECRFVLYCFILYLFSHPSFASIFKFISSCCIVCFTCWVAFSFSFKNNTAFSCVLSFLLIEDFLSTFAVEFPIQVLSFCSCSFEEHWLYHWLISLLCRLVCLILLCFSLRCVFIIVNFFFFFSFGFLAMII